MLLAISAGAVAWHSATPPATLSDASDRPRNATYTTRGPSPERTVMSPQSISLDDSVPALSPRPTGPTQPPDDALLGVVASRYSTTLKALGLSPSTAEHLIHLLAERTLITRDVLNVSRNAGLTLDSDEPALRRLLAASLAPTDAALRQIAGGPAFETMIRCDEDLRVQSVVAELQQRLERSGAPLREDRANALGQILVATAPLRPDGTPDRGAITTGAVSRSWGILSQPQVTALEQLQHRQENRGGGAKAVEARRVLLNAP